MTRATAEAASWRGLTLDPFQQQAMAHVEAGRSVLVSAPTGTGKTLIADRVVDRALTSGGSVIYTAPVKALSNQKFRDYCRLHGDDKVGLVTGDLVIRRNAPCLVMTTEILRNMLLSGESLGTLAAVILDEVHYLADRERGTVWEEVLIYLPPTVQVLGLSATLSNLEEFGEWLSAVRGQAVEVVREDRRAIPLQIHLANRDCGVLDPAAYEHAWRRWKRDGGSGGAEERLHRHDRRGRRGGPRHRFDAPLTSHTHIFRMLHPEGAPYLYFVNSRKDAEIFARALGRRVDGSLLGRADRARMRERLERALQELGPGVLDEELRSLYRKGIAFHHAGAHVQLKTLVEQLYEERLLQVLYTTSTFALGINMPARAVVLDSVAEFDGQEMAPLSVRQFMQKAGRAGRRGLDTVGHAVIKMDFKDFAGWRDHVGRYLDGTPESVDSAFNLSFNSVVNLLARHPRAAVRILVEKSFLAFRLGSRSADLARQAAALEAKLTGRLEGTGFSSKRANEAEQLRKRAEQEGSRVWADVERRRQFLQDIGYLDPNDRFNAGAHLLQHIQITEIFTTEVLLAGVLVSLPADAVFGVLCAMTSKLPRAAGVRARPQEDLEDGLKQVQAVFRSGPVAAADAITGLETTFDPQMGVLGALWAQGLPLEDVSRLVDAQTDLAGSLVTSFRRAKELATQIRVASAADTAFGDLLTELIRTVSRDEVEVVG